MLRVLLECPACVGRDTEELNDCRKCGGRRVIKATVDEDELLALPERPRVLAASLVSRERRISFKRVEAQHRRALKDHVGLLWYLAAALFIFAAALVICLEGS